MKKKKYEVPYVQKIVFKHSKMVTAYNCAEPSYMNDGSCHG